MNTILPPAGIKVCSVSELTRQVNLLLGEAFPLIWVAGEIVNLKRAASGHIYLSLKDAHAQVRAVLWRSTASRLRFQVHDGLEIIARGNLSVYAPRGDYQFVIEELHPKGMGAQDLALKELKEKLARLGYFAPERKRQLPRYPRHIALVTSAAGAAIRDILEILGRRWPAAQVWACPVRVQGLGASEEIAAAIRRVNRLAQVDVLILGRGGGSSEDLAAFNREVVAQAIFTSRVPVVSAVGHEIDVTIADLVADKRALTPSEAAELVTPDGNQILGTLRACHGRLRDLLQSRFQALHGRLQDLSARKILSQPLERIRECERRLDDGETRLHRAMQQKFASLRHHADAQAGRLETLSPLNVLARGYSLTRRETDQMVVRDPEQVQVGDRVVTLVERGKLLCRVEEKIETM
jgi:exodeoxyribonuclease VII large subunit